jgi:hypothetical protein
MTLIIILLFLILLCLLPRSAWNVIGWGLAAFIMLWIAADFREQGGGKLPVWLCLVFIGAALLGGVMTVVGWVYKVNDDKAMDLMIHTTKHSIATIKHSVAKTWRNGDTETRTAVVAAILCPIIFLLGSAAFLAWPA